MSQRFAVRKLDLPRHERYFGSRYYVNLYQTLEHEAYAVKSPVPLPKGKYIEAPPKGAEETKPRSKAYREDPTEYKASFIS